MNAEIQKEGYIWFELRLLITFLFVTITSLILVKYVDPYVITLINLIIVMIFDTLDSIPVRIQIGSISESRVYGNTKQYKVLDKCADILLYLLVLYIHIWMVNIDNTNRYISDHNDHYSSGFGTFEIVLISLFVYRAIGTILYINTFNPMYMVLFPNLFVNCTMVYILTTHVWTLSPTWVTILLILSVIFTFGYEYVHHMLYNKA